MVSTTKLYKIQLTVYVDGEPARDRIIESLKQCLDATNNAICTIATQCVAKEQGNECN